MKRSPPSIYHGVLTARHVSHYVSVYLCPSRSADDNCVGGSKIGIMMRHTPSRICLCFEQLVAGAQIGSDWRHWSPIYAKKIPAGHGRNNLAREMPALTMEIYTPETS